jgi:hypothetical protein
VFDVSALAFSGLIDDDAFELFFFVKEIRDVQKCIALEADIYESRLHSREHAHYAAFVNVADNPLIAFAALDVELGNFVVFDDRDLLFATVGADD